MSVADDLGLVEAVEGVADVGLGGTLCKGIHGVRGYAEEFEANRRVEDDNESVVDEDIEDGRDSSKVEKNLLRAKLVHTYRRHPIAGNVPGATKKKTKSHSISSMTPPAVSAPRDLPSS